MRHKHKIFSWSGCWYFACGHCYTVLATYSWAHVFYQGSRHVTRDHQLKS